ncbi:Crp/Fnr family transcriptional regulator [Tychonema sp. LEGE 07199]|uniref:Crp/Fnr family transcriptional regulator n=1 Tax=unclassified Tychonema TaxID=2642144 RepID=UPI0018813995|nr:MULTISPECIES: Crp/Fnr family transcriptional regulator [unclassified Tychonema]MBE9123042.1 Crp/Fnr family transcriptional regulator [Tychonema sp. LEGE 07199]MBE9134381.1 Crp/Fnr family transcriptional regulator [Tychonema sp. LEGE 07196]
MTLSTYTPGLYASFRHQTFTHRQLVPVPSQGLLRIERGAVRTVTWSEQGTAITLGYWGVGDAIGEPLCGVQPYQIECKTHVEISYIPTNLYDRSLDEIFAHLQQTQEFFCILRTESLRDRLLQLLVWLGKKFGREVAQGLLIDLRLTHQEISEALGITRITVTRLMARLEEEGLIDRSRPQYIVLISR